MRSGIRNHELCMQSRQHYKGSKKWGVLARKDGLRQRADKGWGVRYFHGDLIIHQSLISLCFHSREKPLASCPRLLPCLHCRRAAPGGAADRGTALSRLPLPGRSAGSRGMQGMQGVQGMQGCRASPALRPCVLSRLGRGHKRQYRSSNELLYGEHTLGQEIALQYPKVWVSHAV